MVGDVLDGEHAAIAVADHDRVGKAALVHPGGGVAVVFDALAGELERGAFGGAAVADAQNIVAAAVEREAGKPEAGQHRRQKARGADIKIHRVAVKQQHRPGDLPPLRQVQRAIKRQRIGCDRNQFGAHRRAFPLDPASPTVPATREISIGCLAGRR